MPKIRNVSPVGALDIPLIRAVVDADEVFEVSDEHAARLLVMAANFTPEDDAAHAIAATVLPAPAPAGTDTPEVAQ